MGKRFFIFGNDTGVGKTFLTCRLLQYLREKSVASIGYKPIACGDREDAVALLAASGMKEETLNEINPIYFPLPAAPYAASVIEDRAIDFFLLDKTLEKLSQKYSIILIEGAGGVMTPLNSNQTMRDLAIRWDCSAILVVNNRLGALTQALTAMECLQTAQIFLDALVLNQMEKAEDWLVQSNQAILEERLPGKIYTTEPDSCRQLIEQCF